MVFIVVQWQNENSVSVVNEKQVVGAVDLKEGTTVDISTGTNKGRVAIYKATILKVCATKAQALEIEKSLLTPAAAETTGDEKRKRPRKPSQKVKENVEGDEGKDQEDVDNDTDQFSQKKRRMNKKGKGNFRIASSLYILKFASSVYFLRGHLLESNSKNRSI
ncbi:uncharacterized protein LOC111342003 [Stylophora pistillata]|uniref:uncharacterized protein LOC111342003 n=1 Tax=Stylophora pistillata TaxID=50429 RepID=UPI000C04F5E5|nr:uncharacterized protein LOC111342003 [Stylophora pistillata]